MSRIQILVAEEENIDDLKVPVRFGKDFADSVAAYDLERFTESVWQALKAYNFRPNIEQDAEYGFGEDDEGRPECYIENFLDLMDAYAQEKLDWEIGEQHFDMSDEDYKNTLALLRDKLADRYADYESALCEDALMDNTYALDELKERNGQC